MLEMFIRYKIGKYFLAFRRLPFHFVACFFCCEEVFSFAIVPLIHLGFCCLCFAKKLPRSMSRRFPPLFFSRNFMISGLTFKS